MTIRDVTLTGRGRGVIGLAVAAALWGVGCGAAAPRTRDAASGDAIGGSHDASQAAEPLPTTGATASAADGARGARSARPAGPPPAPTTVGSHGVATVAPRKVSVWLPYWNMSAALESTLANADLVRTASPFWYAIAGDSTIDDDPGAGEESVIDALRGRGIAVVPTVTESEDMRAFDGMLASAPRRTAMVRALLTIARSRDYSGLDLDFEDFAVDLHHDAALADEAAARFPAFLAEVCGALHAIGRSCTVTVMPRTSDAHLYWRGRLATWVYDYGALARVADRVRVMAYDEHAPGGPPGAIAPYAWVQQVVAYASSTMPADRVELALSAYGYDWSGAAATPVTSRQAPRLAAQHGVSPTWSAAQREDTFRYAVAGGRHTVWYEGAAAEYDRARLARAAGFAGVALWAAGGEEPAIWPLLRSLYAN
jgi:spore germination protein